MLTMTIYVYGDGGVWKLSDADMRAVVRDGSWYGKGGIPHGRQTAASQNWKTGGWKGLPKVLYSENGGRLTSRDYLNARILSYDDDGEIVEACRLALTRTGTGRRAAKGAASMNPRRGSKAPRRNPANVVKVTPQGAETWVITVDGAPALSFMFSRWHEHRYGPQSRASYWLPGKRYGPDANLRHSGAGYFKDMKRDMLGIVSSPDLWAAYFPGEPWPMGRA